VEQSICYALSGLDLAFFDKPRAMPWAFESCPFRANSIPQHQKAPATTSDALCLAGGKTAGRSKRRKPSRWIARQRQGTAAIEFALVLPLFCLMFLGMVEMGRAVMVQQVIANAAREGAREAAVDGATATHVTGKVTAYLSNASMPAAAVTFPRGAPEDTEGGDPVEILVSMPFNQVSWLGMPIYLGHVNLEANAVMRREIVY
jgi:hypothetical protein